MPGPIGTIPQGLLSLLALKQTGLNPAALLETVQPSLDLTYVYLNRLMLDTAGMLPGNSAATQVFGPGGFHGFFGFTQPAVVPQNETWWLESFSWTTPLVAADVLVGVMPTYLSGGASGSIVPLAPLTSDTVSARPRTFLTNPLTRPVWVPPGASLGISIADGTTAATITFSAYVRGVRLLI